MWSEFSRRHDVVGVKHRQPGRMDACSCVIFVNIEATRDKVAVQEFSLVKAGCHLERG